jgi:AcrR family transcriptional regulator
MRHAPALFARYGRQAISFRNFAIALKMAPATLRNHFADLDELFVKILVNHIMDISRAIGEVPRDPASRRAAYLAATRAPFGGLTQTHALLVYERQHLPPDLREFIDSLHGPFGEVCAPKPADPCLAAKTLALLDSPCFEAADIETALAPFAAAPGAETPAKPPEPVKLSPQPVFKNRFKDEEGMDTLSVISGVKLPFGGLFEPGGGRPAHAAEPATGHA